MKPSTPILFVVICFVAFSSFAARTPERDRWSWNQQHASVTDTGDLEWSPRPFTFVAGDSPRYIDFEGGDDADTGLTPTNAWKHHPWDADARGNAAKCEGIHTYIFKRGVMYRGTLKANAAGEPGNLIRLTSDPEWGEGAAVICGSEHLTGWTKGADNPNIPEKENVWYIDIKFAPRCVWEVHDGEVIRVPLARTPNWKVSNPEDVMSEWWEWEQPRWWEGNLKTQGVKGVVHLGIDTTHLTNSPDYYMGGHVWSEYAIVMGTPYASVIELYDPERHAVAFQGPVYRDSMQIVKGNRYFLEDRPHYLDEAGEFWFDAKRRGGRLYIRLPDDRDPNESQVEVARHINLIDSSAMRHVEISGLAFHFNNVFYGLWERFFIHPDVDGACIRLRGAIEDIRVANCTFQHVNKAVYISNAEKTQHVDDIEVLDNLIEYTDHGAITIRVSGDYGQVDPPYPTLGDVKVLRNKLHVIGLRSFRFDHSHALAIRFPDTMEVAGNILHRCYGAGIFLFGGKGGTEMRDKPLARNLVYNNKATDTLLAANDWGGIETWQGGPHYVYNNISGNPNGYWNWKYDPKRAKSARLGYAYYLDGSFKNYVFNNVAWGLTNDLYSPLCSAASFQQATQTILNQFANNTAYMFAIGSNWSPAGGRHLFLGNLWMDISQLLFRHGRLKEDTAADHAAEYPHETVAYARNVFYKTPEMFGVFESSGRGYTNFADFQAALAARNSLSAELGVVTTNSPVRNAAAHDFRPTADSAVRDAGVKTFVPWGLYAMVGEWNFRRSPANPTWLLDEHWYMAPYYVNRTSYRNTPRFDLKAVNVDAEDYEQGELENWIPSALKFNGTDQYAFISHADLTAPYEFTVSRKGQKETIMVSGAEIASPSIDTQNMLIEIVFRTTPGFTNGVLVSKLGDAGYEMVVDRLGGISLGLRSRGQVAVLASTETVNDGQWHHVIAEVDRDRKRATIYVDGVPDTEGEVILEPGDSLLNEADFMVGKGADGRFFSGAVDFLRVCQGTLDDAQTSIAELYDWEFDGPFLRDFMGNEPEGEGRDAGAFEYRMSTSE